MSYGGAQNDINKEMTKNVTLIIVDKLLCLLVISHQEKYIVY